MLTDAEKERWWTLEMVPFAVEVRCPWYGIQSSSDLQFEGVTDRLYLIGRNTRELAPYIAHFQAAESVSANFA